MHSKAHTIEANSANYYYSEVITSSSNKARLFAMNYASNSMLDNKGHPIPDLSWITNFPLWYGKLPASSKASKILSFLPSHIIYLAICILCQFFFTFSFYNLCTSVITSHTCLLVSLPFHFALLSFNTQKNTYL